MGGKSRKTGSISRKLIERLKWEKVKGACAKRVVGKGRLRRTTALLDGAEKDTNSEG